MKEIRIDDYTMRYRDEGAGPVIVFAHGTPSSSAEFSEVIRSLKSDFRCIAIDHLGFGHSDKPVSADYSLAAHTARLCKLLETLEVTRFHLVAHDFGGPIALPLAMKRWDDVLSLTLMNTWLWPLQETEHVMRWQRPLMRSRLVELLYRHFNFSAKVLVRAGWGKHRPLSREHHRKYQDAFPTPQSRSGTIAFLQALFNSEEAAWQLSGELAELPQKPTLLLWGTEDPFVSTKTLRRWQALLPLSTTVTLKRVGHFVADEAPELVRAALWSLLAEAAERDRELAGRHP